jgi:hypothetical protein
MNIQVNGYAALSGRKGKGGSVYLGRCPRLKYTGPSARKSRWKDINQQRFCWAQGKGGSVYLGRCPRLEYTGPSARESRWKDINQPRFCVLAGRRPNYTSLGQRPRKLKDSRLCALDGQNNPGYEKRFFTEINKKVSE